jgi:hypothetical protein
LCQANRLLARVTQALNPHALKRRRLYGLFYKNERRGILVARSYFHAIMDRVERRAHSRALWLTRGRTCLRGKAAHR